MTTRARTPGLSTAAWLAAAAGLALQSGQALAMPGPSAAQARVAVLPFMPADASHPSEGWGVAIKFQSRIEGRYAVVSVDWRSLDRLMDEHGLDKKRVLDPAQLAAIGKALRVDGVISGSFVTTGNDSLARPLLVSVASGRSQKGSEFRVARDINVPVPGFFVDPPSIPLEDLPDLRDSMVDYHPCMDAGVIIDDLERRILDLKARYWASQLSKGVNMSAIKFNPGSTITDPGLKREFYARMKAWTLQEHIPELSPTEIKEFAEADEEAIRLARLCGIL